MEASVQVRVDVGGIDGKPHTFLAVTNPDGTTIEYGLVPKDGGCQMCRFDPYAVAYKDTFGKLGSVPGFLWFSSGFLRRQFQHR